MPSQVNDTAQGILERVRRHARRLQAGVRQDLSTAQIVLADEISPDTCRLWDSKTNEKLDKDRFRRDLGGVEDAYAEVMKRLMAHDAQ